MAKVTKPAKSQNPAATTEVKKPAASAAPGTADTTAVDTVKKGRVLYPALVGGPADEDGNIPIVQLKEVPTDWNQKLHKGLRRKDFADDALFLEWRAQRCDAQALAFRAQAEESRKLGSVKDRARAKKLISMQKRIEDLKAQLAGEGVDVNELLATLVPAEKEEEASA